MAANPLHHKLDPNAEAPYTHAVLVDGLAIGGLMPGPEHTAEQIAQAVASVIEKRGRTVKAQTGVDAKAAVADAQKTAVLSRLDGAVDARVVALEADPSAWDAPIAKAKP